MFLCFIWQIFEVFVHRCTMYHHAKIIRRFTFKRLIVSISFYFHFDFSFLWILQMHGNESRQQHKVKCQPQQTLAHTDWQWSIDSFINFVVLFLFPVFSVTLLVSSGCVLYLIAHSMVVFISLRMHCCLVWLKQNSRITDLLQSYLGSYQLFQREILGTHHYSSSLLL